MRSRSSRGRRRTFPSSLIDACSVRPVTSSVPSRSIRYAIASDAPGATLCLWKGGEIYAVATLDEEGNARVPVESRSAGELLVTVSGPSLNAALSTIRID